MDKDHPKEDQDPKQYPPVAGCGCHPGKVCGAPERFDGKGTLARSDQSEVQCLPQGDCRPLWHQKEPDHTSGPAYLRDHGNAHQWGAHRIRGADAGTSITEDYPDLCQGFGHQTSRGYVAA